MKIDQDYSTWQTYKRLLSSVKKYWVAFAIGIAGTVVFSGTDAVIAWAIKPLVDKGLVARDVTFLQWLPLFIVIIFTMRGVANYISSYYISKVGRSIIKDYRQIVFAHLLRLPASFFDRQSSGKLLSLIVYNISQLAYACTDSILTIVQQSVLAIGLIVVMFVISWQLTLFFIVVAPVVAIIFHYMSRRSRKLSHNVQRTIGSVTHIANETIDGFRVVRTFGGENYEKEKFNKATRDNLRQELKVIITNSLGTSAVQIIVALPIAVIAMFTHLSMFNVSVGGFGAIIVAVLRLLVPLRRLAKVNTDIQKGIAGAQSVYAILEEPAEKDTGTISLDRSKGKVEYKNVTFIYPQALDIAVQNVSVVINPGEVIALVGHSGAGKSTFVNLLPRFYDLVEGEILIDGQNINQYHLADLRRQFAFVSQHITLFNDTIYHNIAYGNLANANEKDIIEAAKAAHLLEVIKQMPEGFNSVIGENGVMLSGGQRQRLAIARALLKDAPILILDEATSALDTESERFLQSALEELMKKRTTLVIAHRLSTVENANRILVMDKGKIVEEGNHHQLIAKEGYYSKLYKMQFSE